MGVVDLQHVKFNYPDRKVTFGNFDFQIDAGDLVFLMGANGSGKSTLLKLILGAHIPTQGNITIDEVVNANARWRSKKIAYVPQDKGLDPEMNAPDIFDFVGSAHGLSRSGLVAKRSEIFDALGIDKFKEKRVKYLSGGQRQLVNIGIALLHDPKVLLLDEPFVGLDYGSKSNVIALLRSFNKSVICITHDIDFAESNADKILLLEKGQVVEYERPLNLVQQYPYYIAELDFKLGERPNTEFDTSIEFQTQFNRLILSTEYKLERVNKIKGFIEANMERISSVKTFEQNLRSTLVGKYKMSFMDTKGKRNKKGKGR